VLAVGILNATTGFREIITGLRKLGVPGLLTSILEFTVRYLFVLGDELKRMKLARKARAYNMNKSILHREARKTIVQLLAVMFLRSIGRAERVYCAMLARGYNGEPSEAKAEHIHQTDLIWGTGFIFLTLCIKLLEVGGLIG
jgi:cobalt/nickel transport system permease protein